MEYYFVLFLVAAVSGGTYQVKHVQPITYSHPISQPITYSHPISQPITYSHPISQPIAYSHPAYHSSYNPFVYQHAPVQFVSQVPSVAAVKAAASPAVAAIPAAVPVLAAAPFVAAAPALQYVRNSILTDADKQSTTLIENSPAKPFVQVHHSPFYHFVHAAPKPVVAQVKSVDIVDVEDNEVAVQDPVAVDTPVQDPVAVAVPDSLTAGYYAITPGAIHKAPLPVGASGEGLFSSHHINLRQNIQTHLSRNARSAHHQLTIINPASPFVHHVPAYSNFAYNAPVHSIAYPHAYHAVHAPAVQSFPLSAPVIDTPHFKTVPANAVFSPVPVLGSHIVSPVVSTPAVAAALPAPGYVAVNPGAYHAAPLPVGPSGDGFYSSHHVNLP